MLISKVHVQQNPYRTIQSNWVDESLGRVKVCCMGSFLSTDSLINWSTAAHLLCVLVLLAWARIFVLTFHSPFLRWCGHIFQAFYNKWQIMSDSSEATFNYVEVEFFVTGKIQVVSNLSLQIICIDTSREYPTCGCTQCKFQKCPSFPKSQVAFNLFQIRISSWK